MKKSNISGISHARPHSAVLSLSYAEAGGAYYVFDRADNGGFVIVSGDDATAPVVGYADEGSFDTSTLPAPLQQVLNAFAHKVRTHRLTGLQLSTLAGNAAITPLLGDQSSTLFWGSKGAGPIPGQTADLQKTIYYQPKAPAHCGLAPLVDKD